MPTYYKLEIGKTVFFAEKATTIPEWALGLSGRESMKNSLGLLFEYGIEIPRSFWMKGMNFPLDIVLFDRHQKVVGVLKDLPTTTLLSPPIYRSGVPIMYALEVNVGTTTDIQLGDQLKIGRVIAK